MSAAGPRRILIVDDSAVMRSLLRTVVCSDPGFEVAGTVADGASALTSVEVLRPDLIVLDVEMPVMDGLVTLKQLRARGHKIPVVMCSSLTQRGARVTLDALAAGASDYVAKPSGQASREEATKKLAQELGPKMHALTNPAAIGGGAFPGLHGGAMDGAVRGLFRSWPGGAGAGDGPAAPGPGDNDATAGAGDWSVDGRTGRPGHVVVSPARGFPASRAGGAAHAGAVYKVVCGKAGWALPVARAGGGGG